MWCVVAASEDGITGVTVGFEKQDDAIQFACQQAALWLDIPEFTRDNAPDDALIQDPDWAGEWTIELDTVQWSVIPTSPMEG